MAAQAKQEKVLRAFIVLIDLTKPKAIVASAPASEVQEKLRAAQPQNGNYGPFWWIGEDFKQISQEVDDKVPF